MKDASSAKKRLWKSRSEARRVEMGTASPQPFEFTYGIVILEKMGIRPPNVHDLRAGTRVQTKQRLEEKKTLPGAVKTLGRCALMMMDGQQTGCVP